MNKSKIGNWCFLLTVMVVLNGCGYIERQKLMEERYPFYPEHIKAGIDGSYVVTGMNKEQAHLALGFTLCKSNTHQGGNDFEIWAYEAQLFSNKTAAGSYDCLRAFKRVYFENGLVVRWDNMDGMEASPSSLVATPASNDSDAERYEKLAAMGIADSQYNLGRLYANGQGIPQDYIRAHMWFNLAGASGVQDAVRLRDELAQKMSPAQIAESQRLARDWKPSRK